MGLLIPVDLTGKRSLNFAVNLQAQYMAVDKVFYNPWGLTRSLDRNTRRSTPEPDGDYSREIFYGLIETLMNRYAIFRDEFIPVFSTFSLSWRDGYFVGMARMDERVLNGRYARRANTHCPATGYLANWQMQFLYRHRRSEWKPRTMQPIWPVKLALIV